jgi:methyl-accepting chemotaxis protein
MSASSFPKGDDMTNRWRPVRDEQGQAATFSVVLVAVVVLLAAFLVWKISDLAVRINNKAEKIQETAVPINRATDAVTNIPETNRLASSILQNAQPLEGQLNQIIGLARNVERLAGSINGTASTIDGTASSIDAEARRILPVTRAINADVRQINANLDGSIARAAGIDDDTSNIVRQASTAHTFAACIDRKLVPLGSPGGDSAC